MPVKNGVDGNSSPEINVPDLPDPPRQHRDEPMAILEKKKCIQEYEVNDALAAVLNREQAVRAREVILDRREIAANAREAFTTSREINVRVSEKVQAAADHQMIMLQQANAHLVVATIEAQKMTEQVQIAKVALDHLAHHDALTDLPNRLVLSDRLHRAVALAHRQGWKFAVLFMDLDQFKYINDSLGHSVGDQLLQSVSKRLLSCLRESDTISRQGGDEFVLLLPYIEQRDDAANIAQKLLAAFHLPHRIEHHDLHISASIGISLYPDDGQSAEVLIKSADMAMYSAKESGRNDYKFFEQDMNQKAVRRQSTEAGLRRALERQELVLNYQPKIDLRSSTIVGVEALIRWQHPDRGLLLPARFLSVAEDCGLIVPIGRWVLQEVSRQARLWQQSGLPPITIAINTSAIEFRAKDFISNLRVTLDAAHFDPRYLELELTETLLMRDAESTNVLLRALAEMNIKLAVDDFGTGYSSLSYLRQFPIDTLKIDQSFVARMTNNADDATIVKAVISMAKSLRLRVIAEGVETSDQYGFLLNESCEEGQGYYFGHPMAAQSFACLLKTDVPPHESC